MRQRDWRVLGISATTDVGEIKRAYAAQLKQHRPHEDPEGFQRLRAVYTNALDWARNAAWRDEEAFAAVDTEVAGSEAGCSETEDSDYDDNAADGIAPANELATLEATQAPAAADDDPPSVVPTPPIEPPSDAEVLHATLREALDQKPIAAAQQALDAWCSDPRLAEFGVRRDVGDSAFWLLIDWAEEHAEDWTEARERRAIARRLDDVFRWSEDELRLLRYYPSEGAERVLRLLDVESAQPPQPVDWWSRTKAWLATTSWIRIVWLVFVVLYVLSRVFDAFLDDDRSEAPQPVAAAADQLADADAELQRGNPARALALAEAASGADPVDRELVAITALLRLQRTEQAIARANALRERVPQDARAHELNGEGYWQLRECPPAIAAMEASLAIEWQPWRGNLLAWILATCPDTRHRDGARAVALAERVVAEQPTASYLDTLAAGWAARGDFARAVTEQRRAVAALELANYDAEFSAVLRENLRRYERREPPQDGEDVTGP